MKGTTPITDEVEILLSQTTGAWRRGTPQTVTTTAVIDSGAGIAGALIRHDTMRRTESPEFEYFTAGGDHQLETAGGDLAVLGYTFRRIRWLGVERTIPCLVVPETFPYETLIGRKALEDE